MSNPTLILSAMVNQLEEMAKQRSADFAVQKRPEIDDDITINISNCSRASSMSTAPPLTIMLHEEARRYQNGDDNETTADDEEASKHRESMMNSCVLRRQRATMNDGFRRIRGMTPQN